MCYNYLYINRNCEGTSAFAPKKRFLTRKQDGHQAEPKAKRCSFLLKAMSEFKLTPQQYEKLVFASSRDELMPIVIALLGFQQVDFIDPERPSIDAEYQVEPDGADPFEAVEFKLRRILELFQPRKQENKELVMYASDIVFSANGQHMLKPDREGEDLDIAVIQDELFHRYNQPFLAEWNIAFGVADKYGVNMGNIRIEADYPALTRDEITEYFLASANPGLRMVELGIDKDLSFRLFLDEGQEPITLNAREDRRLLEQFIVQKLPTEEMFKNLLQREAYERSHRYGLIVQGFLNTSRTEHDMFATLDEQ